jgi:hypothetical protein
MRDAASSPNRLIYQTNPPARRPHQRYADRLAEHRVQQGRASLSAALVSSGDGQRTILTRGWRIRRTQLDFVSDPITRARSTTSSSMQAKDTIVRPAAGWR